MHAFVENLSGIVRMGPIAREYGDDWELICTYASVDGHTAVLKGLRAMDTRFKKAHADAMQLALAAAGFHFATWDRYKNGQKVRTIVRDLRRVLTRLPAAV